MTTETKPNETERASCAPAAGSATVEPLKAVEWQFPLGSCHARLSIVADATGEITPEDMDALTEIAALMKRQLVRRQGESQSTADEPRGKARPHSP